MSDRLTLKGLGPADGTYEFDLAELVSINGAGALNMREQHRVKLMSGYRGLEIREAVNVLDAAVMVALVSVLVAREGREVNEQRIWDAKFVYTGGNEQADLSPHRIAAHFHLAGIEESEEDSDDEEGDGGPPA